MCEPTTMAILTVASGAMSYVGQQQAAKAQEASNAQARNLAIQNQNLQIRALRNQEEEDRVRTQEALEDTRKAAEAAQATAMVSAGESGVSGLSVDALLGDIDFQANENNQEIIQTQNFRQQQRQLDREGLGINAQSQINQLPPVQFPSLFGAALETGASAFGAYNTTKANQKKLNN